MLFTEWNTKEYGKVQKEEGRAEGRAEGAFLACIRSVRNLMQNSGFAFDAACKALGLTAEEIEACKREIKP